MGYMGNTSSVGVSGILRLYPYGRPGAIVRVRVLILALLTPTLSCESYSPGPRERPEQHRRIVTTASSMVQQNSLHFLKLSPYRQTGILCMTHFDTRHTRVPSKSTWTPHSPISSEQGVLAVPLRTHCLHGRKIGSGAWSCDQRPAWIPSRRAARWSDPTIGSGGRSRCRQCRPCRGHRLAGCSCCPRRSSASGRGSS